MIRYNPFHPDAIGIVATVTDGQPDPSLGGNYVRVRYEHPLDGSVHEFHFEPHSLIPGTREQLLAAVDRHRSLTPFAPGSKVVIRYNPHDEHASDIVGTVLRFHPGGGHMGCDLADVQYEDPRDGTIHVLPIATYNLEAGDRKTLLERATRHDQQAAQLRRMADEVSR